MNVQVAAAKQAKKRCVGCLSHESEPHHALQAKYVADSALRTVKSLPWKPTQAVQALS